MSDSSSDQRCLKPCSSHQAYCVHAVFSVTLVYVFVSVSTPPPLNPTVWSWDIPVPINTAVMSAV